MGTVQMYEGINVAIQVDASYPDRVDVRPRCAMFDTPAEAMAAATRALELLPPKITTIMISRERIDPADLGGEDPDLADWPAARHVHKSDRRALSRIHP